MIDIRVNGSGDFVTDPGTGDLDLTGRGPLVVDDIARAIGQLAIFALKTDRNDFTLHPGIGNVLYDLWGLPNKPSTAEKGKRLIIDALKSVGITNKVQIESWPEDLNTITYEIKIHIGGQDKVMKLTIRQAVNGTRG